jgi:hypothetical protein
LVMLAPRMMTGRTRFPYVYVERAGLESTARVRQA